MADIDSPTTVDAVAVREEPAANGSRIGIATLDAPKSLNALSLPMIRRLDEQLRRWSTDPRIACIVLEGSGEKAFCAGGDVRSLREAVLTHRGPAPNPRAQSFFTEEYRLDYRIHTSRKPILVWGSGFVMGGGLGLMAGASHRVVTQTSVISMPEITIGLYPDVGGSWFLRRMPRRTGLFLALTGAALNGHDALVVGLADHFVQAGDRSSVLESLRAIDWSTSERVNHAMLSEALLTFERSAAQSRPISNVERHADTIDRVTHGPVLAQLIAQITSLKDEDPWLTKAAKALAVGSPTSAALIWEVWHRARHMSLAEVFRMELILSLQCCEHPDFAEGVRALLIDKDNAPKWTPGTLAEVADEWVQGHFVAPWSPWSNESHPLADLK